MRNSVCRVMLGIAVAAFVCGSSGYQRSEAQALDEPGVASKSIPAYPPLALAACVQGRCAVIVNLDKDGKVTTVETLFGHPLLRPAAEATARDWTFEAAKDGSVQRRQVIKFIFRIFPFDAPSKTVRSTFLTPTDVEVRSYPPEPSCTHCSPRRQKELRKGGCPGQTPTK